MLNDNLDEKKSRYFSLNSTVKADSVIEIIEGIREINRQDDEAEKKVKDYERKPIEVIVNTYGGSVYDGFALVAAIDMSKTPVHTYVLGKAMSMGFIIAASGHKRFAHKLGTLMYHSISTSVLGEDIQTIKEDLAETERIMALYDEYILEKTNVTKEKLDTVKQLKQDWYLSATEAKKLGIIDEIV